MISVLFVCLGNICRSPALEETLRAKLIEKGLGDKVVVDSCGVEPYHPGGAANPKMIEAAKKWGISINTHSKRFKEEYFDTFTHLFAVDKKILERLNSLPKSNKKVEFATKYSSRFRGLEIPDPFIGSDEDYPLVMEMIVDAAEGIALHLEKNL